MCNVVPLIFLPEGLHLIYLFVCILLHQISIEDFFSCQVVVGTRITIMNKIHMQDQIGSLWMHKRGNLIRSGLSNCGDSLALKNQRETSSEA